MCFEGNRQRSLRAILFLVLALLIACVQPTPDPGPTAAPGERLIIATVPAGELQLRRWASAYQEMHRALVVDVLILDASAAQQALARGTVDLALTDQTPDPFYRGTLTATQVAEHPLAVVIHPDNPLRNLTAAAITEVFGGRVPDWNQLGGHPGPIEVYLPPDSAGEVKAFFMGIMSGRRLAPQAIVRSSGASVARAVASDPGGIGLLSAGQASKDVVLLQVDGASPQAESYPWHMPLYLVHGPASKDRARAFIAFVQGLPATALRWE